MSLASVLCRAQVGVEAPLVNVEVHVSGGLPTVCIVGLPEKAVKESKDRVFAALSNAHFDTPQCKVTIALAPADLPKEGGRYDLPIAIGLLAATRQIPPEKLEGHILLGELGLSGELRSVRGVLPVAMACQRDGQQLLVPQANLAEAALVAAPHSHGASNLIEVVEYLRDGKALARSGPVGLQPASCLLDLADVRGQHRARRALEIAAAGGHNLLFYGPPGSGKTMLATRLPGILPPMVEREARESASVASVSHAGFDPSRWGQRPIRCPHHTASAVALVGGGCQNAKIMRRCTVNETELQSY